MHLAKRLEGIGEYYFSQKLREIDELNRKGRNVINLGIGSPDMPPHPSVIEVLQQESARPNVHAYQSYKGSPVLRSAISEWYEKWYGVTLNPESEILPLIGSKEGIMHICMAFFEEDVAVLVPDPGYPTYSSAVKLSGATPMYYDLREEHGYKPDFDQIEKLIEDSSLPVRGLFVNYPQMPTGQLPTPELFQQLVDLGNRRQILVIHDNPYSFILNNEPMSILASKNVGEWVIELNSLSKSHNMAGWRVGMLCGHQQRIEQVLRFKSNMDSGMFLPVQLAAARALSLGRDWFEQLNAMYKNRREKVFSLLDSLCCDYSKEQAGLFVWAKINPAFEDCYRFSDSVLYGSDVFITPGGIFGNAGEKYVRVSLCAKEEKIGEAQRRIMLKQQ